MQSQDNSQENSLEAGGKILVVDDDVVTCRLLEFFASSLGHQCKIAGSLFEGLKTAREGDFDVILLDVKLPDACGLTGIQEFKGMPSVPEVIIITGEAGPVAAETALKNGAWYYLEKPVSMEVMKLLVDRVLEYRRRRPESDAEMFFGQNIVARDPKMIECLRHAARIASQPGSVLITGETGTGKELIARAIHERSPMADGPFVVVDCTNVPESLAQSRLFGHRRGAFTDARESRQGLVAMADGGTLFLDELGELPSSVQSAMLRMVQEGSFLPLGATTEEIVHCRFVACTNRDIEAMVRKGSFRMDLFYRLSRFHISVPPLRERMDDLKPLVGHYLAMACAGRQIPAKSPSDDLHELLFKHTWPGNVRELINLLHATVVNAGSDPVLYPHHLPPEFRVQVHRRQVESDSIPPTPGAGDVPSGSTNHSQAFPQPGSTPDSMAELHKSAPSREPSRLVSAIGLNALLHSDQALPTLKDFREQAYAALESQYLDLLMSDTHGDLDAAGRVADVSRSRIYQLLSKHGRVRKRWNMAP